MEQHDVQALTNQMNQVLRLEETSTPTKESLSACGSTSDDNQSVNNVRLLQFTVFMEKCNPCTSASSQNANFWDKNTHVIIHLADVTAAPKSGSTFEPVEISLISDKFPEDQMGLQVLYNQASSKGSFFLVKLWADMDFGRSSNDSVSTSTPLYYLTSRFESVKNMKLTCTTRVCSFGNPIAEKVEELSGVQIQLNRYLYESIHTPLCDYLINFVEKLKTLDVKTMNGVLENFTVLQVVTNRDTNEILMCLAFLFEVSPPETQIGAACNVYQIV
ncbi:unnamed protein product [Orchesella dallaii]|uniref:YAP binding domain-containing protein n=1 Tax=Orchesella dallaii TaxID=48710 RepID=A0ABP1R788_9HEXA